MQPKTILMWKFKFQEKFLKSLCNVLPTSLSIIQVPSDVIQGLLQQSLQGYNKAYDIVVKHF